MSKTLTKEEVMKQWDISKRIHELVKQGMKMPTQLPNSFHIVLRDGTERDVKGLDAKVQDGALVIRGANKQDTVLYAEGVWSMCEVERKDE